MIPVKPEVILEFTPAGDYIGFVPKGFQGNIGGKRGSISEFTNRSRSRLLKKISQLSKNNNPLFVTLTYHNDYPGDYEGYKYDLHRFFISLRNHFPEVGIIWKLEFQKRGAPHFHLLMWGVDLSEGMDFIPREWNRMVSPGDEIHLKWHRGEYQNKPCVQLIKSWNGVKAYAAKEMGKTQGLAEQPGRFWGLRGNVPLSLIKKFRMDIEVALEIKKAHQRITGFETKRLGYWCYGYIEKLVDYAVMKQEEFENAGIPDDFPPGWYRVYKPEIFGYAERKD